MRLLAVPSERFSTYLALGIMSLLALNFLTAYQISQPLEPRFLFSGLLLGFTAIFLRFGSSEIRFLHRAGYRIATVMAFWSLGFFIFPYPNAIIYLLAFPGFYFLYRIEMKAENRTDEDLAAAGILFLIALFLYVEQQPLHVLLFPQLIFTESGYYYNAPAIIAIGLGIIRLQRWLPWPGLAFTGLLCIYLGSVLTSSLFTPGFWKTDPEIFYAVSYGLLLLSCVSTGIIKHSGFQTFSQLTNDQLSLLQTQFYWVVNLVLQGCVFYLILNGDHSTAALALIVMAPLALLIRYLRYSLTVLLIQWSLFVYPLAWYTFPQAGMYTMLPLVLFLLIAFMIRLSDEYSSIVPNYCLIILIVHYYSALSQFSLLSSLGLVCILFPLLIWMGIPDRPWRVKRRNHFLLWPPVSAICVLCLASEISTELLLLWGLILIYPPVLFFMLINQPSVQAWLNKRKWLFFIDWLNTMDLSLITLSMLAMAAATLCFALTQIWFIDSWMPVVTGLSLIFVALAISIYIAIKHERLINIYASEALVWLGLGLLRWKLDVAEMWRFDIVLEGYILIVAGFVVAGMREFLKKRSILVAAHFNKVTYFYSLIGWLYIIYLQFSGHSVEGIELSSLVMAALFYWVSKTQNRENLILVAVFINVALLTFFYHTSYLNIQFYLLPTLTTILILAHLFSDKLNEQQQQKIRLICGMVMIGSSSYFNVLDFNTSLWYPVTASLLSSLAVIVGMSLQIRIYLYMGFGFFILNTFAVVTHTILNQPPEMFRLIIGMIFLLMGLLFLGSYLLFQMKRKELLAQYLSYRDKISNWH